MSDPTSALAPSYGQLPPAGNTHLYPAEPVDSTALASAKKESGFLPFGEDGLTFYDLIDIVNPLHHIPIVSSIYRNLTGDTIDPATKIAGGALYGGPFGAASSLAGVIIKEFSGKTVSDHVLAFFFGDFMGENENVAIANAKPDSSPAPEPLSFANYADVLEWAQREANAGYVSYSGMNGAIQNALPDGIEVSQWAKRVTAENPYSNIQPVITDAELDLLRAEAEAPNAGMAAAERLDPGKAKLENRHYDGDAESVASIIASNQEVSNWAQNERNAAATAAREPDQPPSGGKLLIASLANYGKVASLTVKPPSFMLNGKY